MKLQQLLLEVFDDRNKSLADLGIVVDRRNDMLNYNFKDVVDEVEYSYLVSLSLEDLKYQFDYDTKTSDDWQVLSNYHKAYINLYEGGSVQPSKLNNQRRVYNALLACLNDALNNQNVKLFAFTPYNDQMELVYHSFVKLINRAEKRERIILIEDVGWVDTKLFLRLSEPFVNEILRNVGSTKYLNRTKKNVAEGKKLVRSLPQIKQEYEFEIVEDRNGVPILILSIIAQDNELRMLVTRSNQEYAVYTKDINEFKKLDAKNVDRDRLIPIYEILRSHKAASQKGLKLYDYITTILYDQPVEEPAGLDIEPFGDDW